MCLLPSEFSLKMDADLVEAEMHRLEKLFHELDLNGDGRIDIHELAEGLHKMGYYHITEDQIMVRKPLRNSSHSICS